MAKRARKTTAKPKPKPTYTITLSPGVVTAKWAGEDVSIDVGEAYAILLASERQYGGEKDDWRPTPEFYRHFSQMLVAEDVVPSCTVYQAIGLRRFVIEYAGETPKDLEFAEGVVGIKDALVDTVDLGELVYLAGECHERCGDSDEYWDEFAKGVIAAGILKTCDRWQAQMLIKSVDAYEAHVKKNTTVTQK